MTVARTEELHEEAADLDRRPAAEVLAVLLRSQRAAAAAVEPALPAIAKAAALAAECLASGGRLAYVAAGSSGLMALADGLELPATYGLPPERVIILFAGGAESLLRMAGAVEDSEAEGARDVERASLGRGDCVIGISASGSTPYVLSGIERARKAGARIISLANNEQTPLLAMADVSVLLETPPEVIAGSTRMGAATAQKIALNLLSTMMAIRLGHVHDGHMVSVQADNEKLRRRAARIVAAIGGCREDEARSHLAAADGSVKAAVLLAAGAGDPSAASALLAANAGHLRPALAALQPRQPAAPTGEQQGE
ncbi:N-acetylmuramic acid 6-phosphate etherase [Consotaella salsifontis]|uniref:N-acetylmuramic acid 6-phosphate etherase n=1 Tax=Consotaella salsifontis TaxID=1365950 RepID=A0A1T4QS78_9HYPH|nr:N-acetylmuramic acid 6-phosphate etherase [Consotaella salsifontis]SKA06108.1 N-acetylmuramic acid 6-phosphate etherase [Consotaella salsifontis]